jgi:hypothetical protein
MKERKMVIRRKTLQLLLAGLSACAAAPAWATPELTVYHSPD